MTSSLQPTDELFNMSAPSPRHRESLAEFANRRCRPDAYRQYEYERTLLDLRWCLYRKLGGTPEYRDLRLLARVGDWRNEADCAFADCVVASGMLPRVRWERIPDGRIRFAGLLPARRARAPDLTESSNAAKSPDRSNRASV